MTESNENQSLLDEAAKNMRIRWEVRQRVRTIRKSWLEVVFDTEYERVARDEYDRCVLEHPEEYFELVAVASAEVCKGFTAFK